MIRVMVTYTVKADRVEENKTLVRAVYGALRALNDPDVHYSTFVKEDGRTFVHIAFFPSKEKQGVLGSLPEFQAFQEGIVDRCDVPPNPEPLEYVGSANFGYPDAPLV